MYARQAAHDAQIREVKRNTIVSRACKALFSEKEALDLAETIYSQYAAAIKVQSLDQEHAAVLPVHAMVEAIRGVPVPLHETSDAPRDGDGDGVSSP